ncbi:siderophore-interacting protein [Kocuria flava]|uniref:Siderophore-interacting protein n=1 Tax=Kocuria flava TaxID=446860 RepID=A0A2N4T587_9MICC|nr:siderophore-interacting protein [Kocuria flava]PLC13388.1 siderophore-interacting protein [Kocuria flava]
MTTPPPARPRRPQLNLTVRERRQLSPSMVRVVLGVDEPERYEDVVPPEKYVKLVFLDPAVDHGPDPDYWALKESLPPEHRPVTRHLTIRRWIPERAELWMDFVLHGDTGHAGPWAAHAEPGQRIIALGPGGTWVPDPQARWTLVAADDAALPAALAVLEFLPATARGEAVLEVGSRADVLPVTGPAGVAVRWVFREEGGSLPEAVHAAGWPEDTAGVQAFAHGEREAMKALRRELLEVRGLDRSQVSLSGYWARGRTEDVFQAEKKLPVGRIL